MGLESKSTIMTGSARINYASVLVMQIAVRYGFYVGTSYTRPNSDADY